MNIFSANIITGAYAGFAIYNQNTIQFGETVIYGDFFSSDGSAGSYVFTTPDGTSLSPITGSYSEQGYWWP